MSIALPFITSAPGKVIIFGEHSAVFNKPAIAASVSSLRSYLLLTHSDEKDCIELKLPDIDFYYKWNISNFQDLDTSMAFKSDELCPKLSKGIKKLLSQITNKLHYSTAYCFLYLFFCLCPDIKGVKFTIKSTLPIGAGLGSSASVSVCTVLAMGRLGHHINSKDLADKEKKFIYRWSLMGEKCIHGTPSGIDNAVSTYGGAIFLQKRDNGETKFDLIDNFPQIPIILTNTKIPRSTKMLVSDVRTLLKSEPLIIQPIIDSMGYLAIKGNEILHDLEKLPEYYKKLLELIRINHGLLVSLGVSHPELEVIRSLSDSMKIGSTKLTGAGGGGCALTLLEKDISIEKIDEFKKKLFKHNFQVFETDLGGVGCCYIPNELLGEYQNKIVDLFENLCSLNEINLLLSPDKSSLNWIK